MLFCLVVGFEFLKLGINYSKGENEDKVWVTMGVIWSGDIFKGILEVFYFLCFVLFKLKLWLIY